jgi:hypothetical protein
MPFQEKVYYSPLPRLRWGIKANEFATYRGNVLVMSFISVVLTAACGPTAMPASTPTPPSMAPWTAPAVSPTLNPSLTPIAMPPTGTTTSVAKTLMIQKEKHTIRGLDNGEG